MRTIVAVTALTLGLWLLIAPPPGRPNLLFKLGLTGFFALVVAAQLIELRAHRDDDEDGDAA